MKIYQEIFPKNDFIYLILLILGFVFFDYLIFSSLSLEHILSEYRLILYVGIPLHVVLIVCMFIFIYQLIINKKKSFVVYFLEDNIEFKFTDKTDNFSIPYNNLNLLKITLKTYEFSRSYPKAHIYYVPHCFRQYIPYEMNMEFILNNGRTYKLSKSFNILWHGYYKFFIDFNKYLHKINYCIYAYDSSGILLSDVINKTKDVNYLKKGLNTFNNFKLFLIILIVCMYFLYKIFTIVLLKILFINL